MRLEGLRRCARSAGRRTDNRSRRPPGWRAAPCRCWSATCDARRVPAGILLKVVGRQPVVVGRRQRSRSKCHVLRASVRRKERLRAVSSRRAARSGRLIHQANTGAAEPQQQDRKGDRQCGRIADQQISQRRAAATTRVQSTWRASGRSELRVAPLHFTRGMPFQQSPARHQHPPQRPQDRVRAERTPHTEGTPAANAACTSCRAWRCRRRRRGAAQSADRPACAAIRPAPTTTHGSDEDRRAPTVVHTTPAPVPCQPTSSNASSAGGTRLRRRLSKIFHRDEQRERIRDALSRRRPEPAGESQAAICQSPRIQRWRRLTSAR